MPATASSLKFEDYLSAQQRRVQDALDRWFSARHERVIEAARYSLLLPSKRLRPVFCLETCRAFSGSDEHAMPAAMAVEMVHSYSLIHDDLPAMDNDDLRRGKPTNHKVYGDAIAILAGDGLLTSAFEVLSKAQDGISDKVRVLWARELSEAAGMNGMVLGQEWDMATVREHSVEALEALHRKKTGALLSSAAVMGAMAAGMPTTVCDQVRDFAMDMGLAFQIRDDILDVIGGEAIGKPTLSDERNQKPTYVSVLGLEKAKIQAHTWSERALGKLKKIPFVCENRLEDLTRFVIERPI